MVFVDAERVQLLGGGVEVGFGVGFGGFGLFEGAFSDGT